jgi:hypothetical protein
MKAFLFVTALLASAVSAHAYNDDNGDYVPREPGAYCATAYDYSSGSTLNLMDGDVLANLNAVSLNDGYGNDWDNKIDRVEVQPGCTFIGYQYQNFNVDYNSGYPMNGFVTVLNGHHHHDHDNNCPGHHHHGHHGHHGHLDSFQGDRISSLKCFCH